MQSQPITFLYPQAMICLRRKVNYISSEKKLLLNASYPYIYTTAKVYFGHIRHHTHTCLSFIKQLPSIQVSLRYFPMSNRMTLYQDFLYPNRMK